MLLNFVPLRGGYWYDGVKAGLFNLYLNYVPSLVINKIGFRSAFGKSQMLYFYGNIVSALSKGILTLADKSAAEQIRVSKSGVVVPGAGANPLMEIGAMG